MVVQTPQCAAEQVGQLLSGALYRLGHGRRLLGHCYGLAAFQAGFYHAALVTLAVFGRVFIAQMDFNSGDVFGKPRQGVVYGVLNHGGQGFVALDVDVGVDLLGISRLGTCRFGDHVFV